MNRSSLFSFSVRPGSVRDSTESDCFSNPKSPIQQQANKNKTRANSLLDPYSSTGLANIGKVFETGKLGIRNTLFFSNLDHNKSIIQKTKRVIIKYMKSINHAKQNIFLSKNNSRTTTTMHIFETE